MAAAAAADVDDLDAGSAVDRVDPRPVVAGAAEQLVEDPVGAAERVVVVAAVEDVAARAADDQSLPPSPNSESFPPPPVIVS